MRSRSDMLALLSQLPDPEGPPTPGQIESIRIMRRDTHLCLFALPRTFTEADAELARLTDERSVAWWGGHYD